MSNNLPANPAEQPSLVYLPSDDFWSGYPGETRGGMDYLRQVTGTMPYGFSAVVGDMPDRVDPRLDEKFAKSWMRVENQGGVGACQGYGLIHCVEYLYAVLAGDIVQLAPLYAYLMSQYFDGINGDSGSTLSGGTKVLEKLGLCLLTEYPKERSYPRGGYKDVPQSAIEAAKGGPFKTLRTVRFKDANEAYAFMGSYAGIIQTGTGWTREMAQPPGHGVIQSVNGRSMGGHSYNICGYMPIDELGAEARRAVPKTQSDKIGIVTNSHSTNWGDDGFGYLTDELFNQLNAKDLMLGRTDMGDIKPRPSLRDFTTRQHSRFRRND